MDLIYHTLKNLDLNDNEINVYLTLLQIGSSPASAIGKRAGIERSHCVYICKRLLKKRSITFVEKNNAFIFTALPPKELFNILESEKRETEDKEIQLNRIIGLLENMVNENTSLPKIQFFEGVDGMIRIYQDILEANKDIYDCNIIDKSLVHKDIISYWKNEYMPQREKMTNKSFSLYNREEGFEEYTKYDKKVRRTTLFIPKEEFPFKSQIMIYGKKIAFLSLSSHDLTGTIIENDAIFETQFSLFRMAWNYAKTLPRNECYVGVEI